MRLGRQSGLANTFVTKFWTSPDRGGIPHGSCAPRAGQANDRGAAEALILLRIRWSACHMRARTGGKLRSPAVTLG